MIDTTTSDIGFMNGVEAVQPCLLENKSTYTRLYTPTEVGDDLRGLLQGDINDLSEEAKEFETKDVMKEVAIGNYYKSKLPDGHFHYIKRGEDFNPFSYAISTFGTKIETLSNRTIEDFRKDLFENEDSAQKFELIVQKYFVNVDAAQDGDLAVYSLRNRIDRNGYRYEGTVHAGIYHTEPCGGEYLREYIESAWITFCVCDVVEHEPFFTKSIDGDKIQFYRLKENSNTQVISKPQGLVAYIQNFVMGILQSAWNRFGYRF